MLTIRKKQLIICLFAFAFFLILEKNSFFMIDGNDDGVFAEQIASMPFIEWIKSFYLGWSGRVFLTYLGGALINRNIWIWKILNAMVFTQIIYFICKIFNNYLIPIIFIGLYFSMPKITLANCNFWCMGTLNYLWPASFMVVELYLVTKIINKEEIKKHEFSYCIFGAFFCSNQEQAGLLILFSLFIALLYRFCNDKKINKKGLILFVTNLIIYLITILAPGNYQRQITEVLQWFPNFYTISILRKILSGLLLIIENLFTKGKVLIFGFCLIFIYNEKKRYSSYIPFILFVSTWVFKKYIELKYQYYQDIEILNIYNNLYGYLFYLRLLTLLIILYKMTEMLRKDEDKIIIMIILCSAMLSTIMMGLSPTIYGSGNRVFYLSYLLLDIGMCFALYKSKIYKNKYLFFIIIMTLAYLLKDNIYYLLVDNGYMYIF